MSTWKKIIVSGSGAHLSSVTASNGSIISGSLTMSGSITNVDNLDFNTTPPQSLSSTIEGRLSWDNGTRDLIVGAGNNVDIHVGQQEWTYVYNAEATTLNKGEIVFISGSQGNTIAVKRADDSGDPTSAGTLGMVGESIASGAEGLVLVNGLMRKLDTSTLTAGKLLYLSSTPGAYTETIPTPPSHSVRIGYVAKVDASQGEIYIKVDNGYEIGELHDIIDGTTTTSYGDLLVKSGSVWKNSKQLTGSYGLTGSLQATSFTGSLQGSASYAIQSLSSSFATNSSTASYVLNAVSASFATTASYVLGGGGASVTSPGDNRIITSDGTVGGLVGETNLTFDGSTLAVTGKVTATSFTGSLLYFQYDDGTNYSQAIGIGGATTNNYFRGMGIGYAAYNNYDYGIGIGYSAIGNYSSGIGIGREARDNDQYGIGIGYQARYSQIYGIGIGYNAQSNEYYGLGIGYQASDNNEYGIGIGYQSQYNYLNGIGIGRAATTNYKSTGTVAIGSYTKAERQNEFVTTATNGTTNKAQSIIQKFREKSLASNGGVNQEIYTDASSARLTIFASSIYQFRIQINAIEATTFTCKSWEVVGAIKRDASNTTSMIGTPIYTVTSEEAGSTDWDVTVDANDTNEALRIQVKHNATNNVTFSATVWATETRL